ncbi:MAG: adenylosuccinate lyase [Opitutae bacterium]|nr:adenylosuccinate lyase [Opitutae bacterium]
MSEEASNVLADRYASGEMRSIWSARGKVSLERELWLAVMKAQRDLGLPIPEDAIAAYEGVKDQVDLDSMREREKITKHDVKARLEEFSELAGHQHAHKGMTSRDLTENVEQLQVLRSLRLVLEKAAAGLLVLAKRAEEFADTPVTGRSHNVPAQLTTVGKCIASAGEEMERAMTGLWELLQGYPFRGLKGAVGTQADQLTLFEGDTDKVDALEKRVLEILQAPAHWKNVGQVYPRSLDFETVSRLYQLASAAASFSKTMRLAAGQELLSEGFAKGQTGSSAMPHKVNSRSCERINGFHAVLRGYLAMTESIAGDQWNEGDVSCSVVRRVALPDAFFAIDGLLETFHVVLRQMEVFEDSMARENARQLPFLATTTFLMEAVKAGTGREDAHAAIKEHALAVAKDLRSGKIEGNDLGQRLAADERLGLSGDQIDAILAEAAKATGAASQQARGFASDAQNWLERFPDAADYTPGEVL